MAAIQCATAGLAPSLLSPAGGPIWQAAAASAPRLLRLMRHHGCLSSSTGVRGFHSVVHSPAPSSASGGRQLIQQQRYSKAPVSVWTGSDHQFSSCQKFTNKIEEEEEELWRQRKANEEEIMALEQTIKRKRELGTALMTKQEGIESINRLCSLLGNNDKSTTFSEEQVQELRNNLENKKRAYLQELLNENIDDGRLKEEKKMDVISAAHQLRDALAQQERDRAIQSLSTKIAQIEQKMNANKLAHEQSLITHQVELNTHYADLRRMEKHVVHNIVDIKEMKRRLGGPKARVTMEEPEPSVTMEDTEPSVTTEEPKARESCESSGVGALLGSATAFGLLYAVTLL